MTGTDTFVNGLFITLRSLVVREQRNSVRNEETIGQPPPPAGYYYSSSSSSRAAPSPAYPPQGRYPPNGLEMAPQPGTPRSRDGRSREESTPSYYADHLATFAVGRQYGLVNPSDGIRKLQEMERRSAIWAQSMVLRLEPDRVTVEDDNGDLVESFPMELVEQPTAHVSNDPRETYNNILLFVVKEDPRNKRSSNPTEMHIFQCNRVAATEVAEDLQSYLRGNFRDVRKGRRVSGQQFAPANYYNQGQQHQQMYPDNASVHSDGSEQFEIDVNTLNRCFDDIERFVARIQAAGVAMRTLEEQARRYRTASRDKKGGARPNPDPHGILQMRARLPNETEFVDIFRKFKLCFNLLAKLKHHIHDPNAPELLHFLFSPLTVILDACHRGHGRPIAPQVVAPLISLEARELMQNCLSTKEMDIWMSMGDSWRTTPEDWAGPLPLAYRPVFIDGFAPYGLPETAASSGAVHPQYSSSTIHQQPAPLHRGESAPPAHYRGRDADTASNGGGHHRGRSIDVGGVQSVPGTPVTRRSADNGRGWSPAPSARDGVTTITTSTSRRPPRHHSVDNVRDLDLDRINFERERVEFEKIMLEKEKRLLEEEKSIRAEKARLEAERKLLHEEAERRSLASNSYNPNSNSMPSPRQEMSRSNGHNGGPSMGPPMESIERGAVPSPRERAFLEDLLSRGSKVVQVTYDRTSQNSKELSVHRGEYLEVLNDVKNWWECKNMHSRVGYVPHTILTLIGYDAIDRYINGDPYGQRGSDTSVYRSPASPSHGGHQGPLHQHSNGWQQSYDSPVHYTNGQHHYNQQQQPQPSPQPQRFVVVSEAGIQTSAHSKEVGRAQYRGNEYARVRSPSPPQAPEPPAPPPIEGLQEAIGKMRARPAAEPISTLESRPKLNVVKRMQKITREEEALLNEINSTVSRGGGRKILSPKRVEPTVQLSERSDAQTVNRWLVEKGFSPRTIEILHDMEGSMLFSLSRNKLIEVCGREEGSRVYSQMLVQKKRSAYVTRTGAELTAILNYRKENVDARNEMPSDEPPTLVNGKL